jgi:ABC-type sugar transport system ATPase subunit
MAPALQLSDLGKRFGAAWAVRHVDLALAAGEIHALVGENGAGKSTLIKLIAGVYRPDEGRLAGPDGAALALGSPREALAAGIGVVHQELDLFDNLTVAENIALGPPRGRPFRPSRRVMHRRAAAALSRLGERGIAPGARVERLPTSARQIVAIAKALGEAARVLIFDEPTSALNSEDAALLLGLIRALRDDGVAILYVSHKLAEIFAIADRVTVLRDGGWVGTWPAAELNHDRVVQAMLGRLPAEIFPPRPPPRPNAPPLLAVTALTGRQLAGVSLHVAPGEIVALAGLPDAGPAALLRALFGLDRPSGGAIELAGRRFPRPRPAAAISRGCAYLPGDRLAEGLLPLMNVLRNVEAVAEARRLAPSSARRRAALAAIARLSVRAASLLQPITALSGGNQQKALIARWLTTEPKLLLLDDPTRGIDVGAKTEIYGRLREIARGGTAILFTSSDSLELAQLPDRILVFRAGRVAEEIEGGVDHAELDRRIAAT